MSRPALEAIRRKAWVRVFGSIGPPSGLVKTRVSSEIGIPSPQNKFCPACGSDLSQGNDEAAETSTVSTVPTRSQSVLEASKNPDWWLRWIQWSLVFTGFPLCFLGMTSLNRATAGLGFVAVACFLGIMARISQAEWHERKARRDISED